MKKIFFALLASIVAYLLSSWSGLIHSHSILIACIVILVVLWTNEGLPLGVVALLPIILFPSAGLIGLKELATNYASPIIFLFIGGFFIALGFEKTNLHVTVAHKMLTIFPSSIRGRIYALMITSALLSSLLSNTTITLMLIPIVLSLAITVTNRSHQDFARPDIIAQEQKITERFLIATAYGASIGGILTPIGTPPNLILMGFLTQNNLPEITFTSWMIRMFPIVFLMLLIVPWFLSLGLSKLSTTNSEADSSSAEKELHENNDNNSTAPSLTQAQKKMTWFVVALVVVLFANSGIAEIDKSYAVSETFILLGAGLLLFFPKLHILTWEDTAKMPWEIIFLFGAGFAIANTFMNSGLPANFITQLQKLGGLESLPLWLILMVVALVVSFSTEITSNTAFIAIALPIFLVVGEHFGVNSVILLSVATVATSYAFMLPIATPPNAIIMASRKVKVKNMVKLGLVINLIGVVCLSTIAYLWW